MENIIKVVDNYEDFVKVFTVFSGAPFFEYWSTQELHDEYKELKDGGEIFGYYLDDSNIAGLVTVLKGAKKSHPVIFPDPKKVMYISDIAVINEQRGKGFAKHLADFIINYTEAFNEYQHMYMRTNLEGSMSEGIFLKRGFEVMRDQNNQIITQEVSFERTNGETTTDTRKFLSKRLILK